MTENKFCFTFDSNKHW